MLICFFFHNYKIKYIYIEQAKCFATPPKGHHARGACCTGGLLWPLPRGWPKPKLGPGDHGCMALSAPMGSHTHVGPVWHLGPHHKLPHNTQAQKSAKLNVQKKNPSTNQHCHSPMPPNACHTPTTSPAQLPTIMAPLAVQATVATPLALST